MAHLFSVLMLYLSLLLAVVDPGVRQAGTAGAPARTAAPTVPGSPTPTLAPVRLLSPVDGQALQGTVNITGDTQVEGFQFAELEFAYASGPANTWFLIEELDSPVSAGLLARWDTTTITDGVYRLRLTVTGQDGQETRVTVFDVRVRNYTRVETNTPAAAGLAITQPAPGSATAAVASKAPAAPQHTPAPPAAKPPPITRQQLVSGLGTGMLAVTGLFALMGVYERLKGLKNRNH